MLQRILVSIQPWLFMNIVLIFIRTKGGFYVDGQSAMPCDGYHVYKIRVDKWLDLKFNVFDGEDLVPDSAARYETSIRRVHEH